MEKRLEWLLPAFICGGAGLILGVVAGWWGVLAGNVLPPTAPEFISGIYPWLALVLPLVLLGAAIFLKLSSRSSGLPKTPARALPAWVICGLVGGVLGTLFFGLLSGLILTSQNKGDPSTLLPNYLSSLGLVNLGLVLGLCGLAGLCSGLWYSFK